jgi:hypothetical protein
MKGVILTCRNLRHVFCSPVDFPPISVLKNSLVLFMEEGS